MTKSILSTYWAPGHMRPTDLRYMHELKPFAIRILDGDSNQMRIAHEVSPNSLLFPRDWALSEQHDDMRLDPIGTGQRHARTWRAKIDNWRALEARIPVDDKIVVVGINEPRVWEALKETVQYTVAFLDECTRLGLRASALNLSVGWPANNAPDAPPDWKPYAPIEAAIKRGNHFLVVHEYWYRSGPKDNWGWWAGRIQHCPWDVPIIIGECGIDLYVDMNRWDIDGKPNRGWVGNVSAEAYAGQMTEYAKALDSRVVGIMPFLTDYRDNRWASFDTQDANPFFLSKAKEMVPQDEVEVEEPSTKIVRPLQNAIITQHWGQEAPAYAPGIWGHTGTDFAKALGTPIACIADGVVSWSDFDESYGNYVRIEHKQLGLYSFYAHLKEAGAPAGKTVAVGETIGNVGSTGNSTGPHLHFELRMMNPDGSYRNDCPMSKGRVDPETWFVLNGVA